MVTYLDLEQAIISTLKAQLIGVKHVAAYNGEAGDEESVKRMTRNVPAALVAQVGSTYKTRGTQGKWREIRLVVYLVDKNLTGKQSGINNMLESVLNLLDEKTLGLEIHPLSVLLDETVLSENGLFIHSVVFETKLPRLI